MDVSVPFGDRGEALTYTVEEWSFNPKKIRRAMLSISSAIAVAAAPTKIQAIHFFKPPGLSSRGGLGGGVGT